MNTVNIVFKSLYACAHQCGFCHVLHVPRNVSYMSNEDVKSTFNCIESLFEGSRVEMEMSGGEFTLRRDAIELIEYLRAKRIFWSSLVLDTMAVPLADETLAQSLGRLFHKANVSVHACDADLHAITSASRTSFAHLEAGLKNLFRFFPAVFTNTSINRFNYSRLSEIARFILNARRVSPSTPLCCLFYLPVYRRYGAAKKENAFRLQGEDNAKFLPDAAQFDELRAEFDRARSLLAAHDVPAVLRDFNVPACIYHEVSGTFPENAFGLPNFMKDCYFVDYAHPISEKHTLEEVYPSMEGRVKVDACRDCVADEVCPGVPEQWLEMGYHACPVAESEYLRWFPLQVLNQTLFSLFHDAVRAKKILNPLPLDWAVLSRSFYTRLAGDACDTREARRRIAALQAGERANSLIAHLKENPDPVAHLLADALQREQRSLTERQVRESLP